MARSFNHLTGHAKALCLALGLMLLSPAASFGFSLVTYNGVPARWQDGKVIEIELDQNFSPFVSFKGDDGNGPTQTVLETVTRSIDAWRNVTGTSINLRDPVLTTILEDPHYDGKNQIKMYTDQWANLSFKPPTTALAVTISTYTNPNEIIDSDIFFNGVNFEWANFNDEGDRDGRSKYDIENVLTHELGHFLGLDHTSVNSNETEKDFLEATMFFSSRPGDTERRTLNAKDILGVQHLYTTVPLPQPEVYEAPDSIRVDASSEPIIIKGNNFRPTASVVIVRNNGQGDINGRVVSVSDDEIIAKFPATTLQTGSYDLVVANAHNKFVKLTGGLEVVNPNITGVYESETDSAPSKKRFGCSADQPFNLWLFIMILAAIIYTRRRLRFNMPF